MVKKIIGESVMSDVITVNFDYHNASSMADAKTILEANFPIRCFKNYFDRENLLLTDYRETECYHAIALLECYNGMVIMAKNCICGYRGHGPHNTVKLLEILNVSKVEAEKYVFNNNAVELYFDRDGNVMHDKTNLTNVFEGKDKPCPLGKIDLSNISHFDARERMMYLVEPKGDSVYSMVQLLRIMKPMMLTYYIGRDNSKYIDIPWPLSHISDKRGDYSLYSFALIKGEVFNVVCLFNQDVAKSAVNNLATLIGLPTPFKEVALGGLTCMTNQSYFYNGWDKLFAIIKELQSKPEIYIQQPIKIQEKGRISFQ